MSIAPLPSPCRETVKQYDLEFPIASHDPIAAGASLNLLLKVKERAHIHAYVVIRRVFTKTIRIANVTP